MKVVSIDILIQQLICTVFYVIFLHCIVHLINIFITIVLDGGCSKGCCEKNDFTPTENDTLLKKKNHRSKKAPLEITAGVLTVSDRAYNGVYKDKSGPLLVQQLKNQVKELGLIVKVI